MASNDPSKDGFIKVGDVVVTFDRGELTEDLKEFAATHLRETPDVRDDALRRLKEMVKVEERLNLPLHREDFLLLFLRGTQFYPEEAMKLLRKYYTFKFNHPKLCANLLPSTVKKAFETGVVAGVFRRDRHGRRVLILKAGANWNPSTCSIKEFIRAVILTVKMSVFEPKTQVAGGAVVIDIEGMELTQAKQFSPRLARSMLTLVQDCMALRLQAIHVVNQPHAFDMIYAIFKPFTHKKLQNMIHLHGTDREKLIEDIGSRNLPKQYGGELDLPEIPGSAIHQLLCHFEEDYRELSTYGYSQKPNKKNKEVKTVEEIRGITSPAGL